LDWNWTGIGLELDWNWTGIGLELAGIGLELDWNWTRIGLDCGLLDQNKSNKWLKFCTQERNSVSGLWVILLV